MYLKRVFVVQSYFFVPNQKFLLLISKWGLNFHPRLLFLFRVIIQNSSTQEIIHEKGVLIVFESSLTGKNLGTVENVSRFTTAAESAKRSTGIKDTGKIAKQPKKKLLTCY